MMTDVQAYVLLTVIAAVCLAALIAGVRRSWKNRRLQPRPEVQMRLLAKTLPPVPPARPKPREHSPRLKHLKQNLLTKVLHDDATAARLLQFEIDEGRRRGLPEEDSETLLERAIERFERDNR
jgi:hypothetical protein